MAKLKDLVFVVDLDKTICEERQDNESYAEVQPKVDLINVLNALHSNGAVILIDSARNMLTQQNDEAKVIKNVGLTTLQWLQDHNVEYDGFRFGKSIGSCYIDDKALRPNEFLAIFESLEDKNDLNELDRKIKEYLKEH